jgi:hypothetical protein
VSSGGLENVSGIFAGCLISTGGFTLKKVGWFCVNVGIGMSIIKEN